MTQNNVLQSVRMAGMGNSGLNIPDEDREPSAAFQLQPSMFQPSALVPRQNRTIESNIRYVDMVSGAQVQFNNEFRDSDQDSQQMLRGVQEILEEDGAESVQSQNFNMAKYVKDLDS